MRRDLGEFEQALQLYNQAYELSYEMEPSLRRSILLSMSTLFRWQGDFMLAEQLAGEAAELLERDDGHNSPESAIIHAKKWIGMPTGLTRQLPCFIGRRFAER